MDAVLFVLYSASEKRNYVSSFVDKARAICLVAESIREEMELKWKHDIFDTTRLRQYAETKEMDKLLAMVPVFSAWNAAMRKADAGGYTFKVPKFQPHNPKNLPDPLEAEALQRIHEKNLNEYFTVDPGINAVRYFLPIRLSETCMYCHGDPATSKSLWGNTDGRDPTGVMMENWKVGEIHGTFEIIQSLDAADARLRSHLLGASGISLGGILLAIGLLFLMVRSGITRPIYGVMEVLRGGASEVSAASGEVSAAS